MPKPDQSAALSTFRNDPATTILLMDESGALGLDLSFVNHIFLMEPLTDAALEQQVREACREKGEGGMSGVVAAKTWEGKGWGTGAGETSSTAGVLGTTLCWSSPRMHVQVSWRALELMQQNATCGTPPFHWPRHSAAAAGQVISRAWRMGCTSTVHVEVLAMAGTAEEHLVALRQRAERGQLSAEVGGCFSHVTSALH